MAKVTVITRFWYWVYRWTRKLNDYADETADSRRSKECNCSVSHTLDLPEPDFEEVKHLYSKKPLRFYKRNTNTSTRIETVKQKLIRQGRLRKDGRNKQAVFFNEYHSECVPDGMTDEERRQYFLERNGTS